MTASRFTLSAFCAIALALTGCGGDDASNLVGGSGGSGNVAGTGSGGSGGSGGDVGSAGTSGLGGDSGAGGSATGGSSAGGSGAGGNGTGGSATGGNGAGGSNAGGSGAGGSGTGGSGAGGSGTGGSGTGGSGGMGGLGVIDVSGPSALYAMQCMASGFAVPVTAELQTGPAGDFPSGGSASMSTQVDIAFDQATIDRLRTFAPTAEVAAVQATVRVTGATPNEIVIQARGLPATPVTEYTAAGNTTLTHDNASSQVVFSLIGLQAVLSGLPDAVAPGGRITLNEQNANCTQGGQPTLGLTDGETNPSYVAD